MSGNREHITHYTAADIQRYVQGKLSAPEMHAMEKAALDDPFLADAIEGYQHAFTDHDENLVSDQLQQLQQKFQTQNPGPGKVVAFKPFRYWQAVAAAVVVIITGVWVYSLVTSTAENSEKVIARTEQSKEKPSPTTEEQQPKQQGSAPALPDERDITGNTDSKPRQRSTFDKNKLHEDAVTSSPAPPPVYSYDLSRADTDSAKQRINARETSKPAMKDVAADKKEGAPTAAAAAPDLMRSRRAEDIKFQDRERETELITITKNDSAYSFYAKKAGIASNNKNLSGFIKGQVTDHKNNPIANAYLQIPNNNNNFYTDKTGFFKIPVTDSVVDVAVNVTGYGTQNFRLQNNAAMNNLQLQPANVALNEVEVRAIKGKKLATSSNKYPNVMEYDAEPAFGWVAFDQYLEKNKKIPAGAPAITGKVIVSFQVNKKGDLSDFKVEQPLSKSYDDEAIRLIMQGPSWKLLKGRKARVTVMVRF